MGCCLSCFLRRSHGASHYLDRRDSNDPPKVVALTKAQQEMATALIVASFGGEGGPPEMVFDWAAGAPFKAPHALYEPLRNDQGGAFPELPERQQFLHYNASWVFHVNYHYGTVFGIYDDDDSSLAAVMCCMPPGQSQSTCIELQTLCKLGLPPWEKRASEDGWNDVKKRMNAVDKSFRTAHQESMKGKKHWYLNLLAVRPDAQGKGYGKRLLRLLEDLAQADGVPIYLECTGSRNESIYSHFGYKTVQKYVIEAEGVESFDVDGGLIAMVRLPDILQRN